MHILFVPKWYPNIDDPQLGIFIHKHAQAISTLHRVTVLYIYGHTHDDMPKISFEEQQTDNLKIIKVYFKKNAATNQFQRIYNLKLYYDAAKKAVKKYETQLKNADWAHYHVMGRNLLINNYLKKIATYKIAITEHQSAMLKSKPLEFWRLGIYQNYAQKAKFVTCVSEVLKQGIIKKGINANFKIVPNVVENPFTKQTRNDGLIKLLNVSDMFDSIKNVSGIIKAFSVVNAKNPNTRLTLVGDGPDFEMIKSLITSLNLQQSVTLKGRLANNDVLSEMQFHDIYITNSNTETFSIATAEAAMAGLPVIATKCGGPETFVNQQIGLLIEKNNHNELIKAMQTLIESYNNYNSTEMNQYIKGLFSEDSIAHKFDQLYSQY